MITPSQVCTVLKYVLLLALAAFLLYVIIAYPEYRWYAVIFISLVIICRFQLWQYTPCDRKRVRKEVLRRLRAAEDNFSSSEFSSNESEDDPESPAARKKNKTRKPDEKKKKKKEKQKSVEPYGERNGDDDRFHNDDDDDEDDDGVRNDRPIVQQVFVDARSDPSSYPQRPPSSARSPGNSNNYYSKNTAEEYDDVDLSFPPAANSAARRHDQPGTTSTPPTATGGSRGVKQNFTPLRRNFSPMLYPQRGGSSNVGNRSDDLPVFDPAELAGRGMQHVSRSSPRRSASLRRTD